MNNHNHMHVHMGPKKIFPTPGGSIYMCVTMVCTWAYARVTGGVSVLRIFDPGWKNLTFDVLLIVSVGAEKF